MIINSSFRGHGFKGKKREKAGQVSGPSQGDWKDMKSLYSVLQVHVNRGTGNNPKMARDNLKYIGVDTSTGLTD